VTEIKTVPYVPLSHPFVERLIGTVRREYLDRTLFWTTADLETKLSSSNIFIMSIVDRTHAGLEGTRTWTGGKGEGQNDSRPLKLTTPYGG